jgi:hypothetical protein
MHCQVGIPILALGTDASPLPKRIARMRHRTICRDSGISKARFLPPFGLEVCSVRRQKSMRSGRISCEAAGRDPDSNVNRWNSRRTGLSRPVNSKNHPFRSLIPIRCRGVSPHSNRSHLIDSSQRTHAATVNAGDVSMALVHHAYTRRPIP